MAKMSSRIASLVIFLITIISCRIGAVNGTSYTVGESSGWSIGADYTTWASDKTFKVGDTLVFNYAAGHTVDEVSKKDYDGCTTGNAITSDSSGATSVTLKTDGDHYYICGSPSHCSGGMKLAVTVAPASSGGTAAGATPAPDTTTSPPSTTAPTTTTTTSPTTGTTVTTPTAGTTVTTPTAGTLNQPSSSAALSPAAAAFFAVSVVVFKFTSLL